MEKTAAHMRVENVDFTYQGGKRLFEELCLTIPKGKITTLIGPNGCGKSTLLGILTRAYHAEKGTVFLEEKAIQEIKRRIFSQKSAVLHQHNHEETNVTVRELAAYGRTPYQGFGQKPDTEADAIIDWALEAVGLEEIQDRSINELSGGQRQRAWMAMSLCQKPEILFLDEPTTYLDIYYQLELLQLVKRLNAEYGMTVVLVLHDINQALNYSDHMIVMKGGRVIQTGTPDELAREELIETVYSVKSQIFRRQDGKYNVDFY